MKIFISWSQEPSRTVARFLHDWLRELIQALQPWMSDADIPAGARWRSHIAEALRDCRVGVVCVTPGNQHSPYLTFEYGALAKAVEGAFVCPYLIGMKGSDLLPGPLTEFQLKLADQDGTWDVVRTINDAMGADALDLTRLEKQFDRQWPELERILRNLPPPEKEESRQIDNMLAELVDGVRSMSKRLPVELAPVGPSIDLKVRLWFSAAVAESVVLQVNDRFARSFHVTAVKHGASGTWTLDIRGHSFDPAFTITEFVREAAPQLAMRRMNIEGFDLAYYLFDNTTEQKSDKRTHDGLKKRCDHSRKHWPEWDCTWWFGFHHGDGEYRYSLTKLAELRGEKAPKSKHDAIVWSARRSAAARASIPPPCRRRPLVESDARPRLESIRRANGARLGTASGVGSIEMRVWVDAARRRQARTRRAC